jgi:hypothetical protein
VDGPLPLGQNPLAQPPNHRTMRIDKSIRDDFCILSLKGEFDKF